MYGDLPVLHVDITLTGKEGRDADSLKAPAIKDLRHFRFLRPAEIFLSYNLSGVKTFEYPVIIDVQRRNTSNIIINSSCVFITLPPSTVETIVLDIRSDDKIPVMAKLNYTDKLFQFDDVR
ncbi:hypothetical protein PoB_003101700 [Plakobranchus ocellatus]|uniref:Uncharacterized protein n=1 Tax=Plakobranchus ocellatus TaxID=259542 RepID=A0AAV4AC89_9GAST|nr:hypothetical protein PoB_003101700 [Plakobranchus ocellatus]